MAGAGSTGVKDWAVRGKGWAGEPGLTWHHGPALPQEKEMEKQRLLYQQARLHNRGAAEMVLQMISACKGAFHEHPAPEHAHPVFTLPNLPVSCGPSSTLSQPCMPVVCTHPSPCMFHLPCNFSLTLQSRSHLLTPPTPSLTSPVLAVFWWMENATPKLSGPSFVPCPLQERREPWCPPP